MPDPRTIIDAASTLLTWLVGVALVVLAFGVYWWETHGKREHERALRRREDADHRGRTRRRRR